MTPSRAEYGVKTSQRLRVEFSVLDRNLPNLSSVIKRMQHGSVYASFQGQSTAVSLAGLTTVKDLVKRVADDFKLENAKLVLRGGKLASKDSSLTLLEAGLLHSIITLRCMTFPVSRHLRAVFIFPKLHRVIAWPHPRQGSNSQTGCAASRRPERRVKGAGYRKQRI